MHNDKIGIAIMAALAVVCGSSMAQNADAGQGGATAQAQQGQPRRAAPAATAAHRAAGTGSAIRSCTAATLGDTIRVTLGKSTVVHLESPVTRLVVGGQPTSRAAKIPQGAGNAAAAPAAAPAAPQDSTDGISDVDITLLGPTELFVLGRKSGAMNVVLQSADGRCQLRDIVVTIDPQALQSTLSELMPEETNIRVRGAENALILAGSVSDAVRLDEAMNIATSYGDGKKVVNLLRVSSPQQVMLEVKIAEVSRKLLDRLGSSLALNRGSASGTAYQLASSFLTNGGAFLEALKIGRTASALDGQKDDGLVRVLAEPNIMAISGQQASFLSGGKIFIPVAQNSNGGAPVITLEEKEFGVGVKFSPTVLSGTRINLKMVSEVSDLSQTGSPFTTVNGVTSVLPSLTVRRADTTVQLNDGQSLVIAGLIQNNITETVKRFPGLGEIPVIGALARSTEFQTDRTELLFVITPRLVQPLAQVPTLPTDNHVPPSRAEVYLNGSLESATPAPSMPASENK